MSAGDLIERDALCFGYSIKNSWKVGKVTAWDGKFGSVQCTDGETLNKLNVDMINLVSQEVLDEDVDDLLNLTLLHDSTLLHVLRVRYMRDVIYTNIGAIVIALNPFNFKIPWYMDDNMPKYLKEGDRIEENLPHSWAVAHNTYHELLNDNENQTVLVSGESGAGKTEASKIVMKYLAAVSCKSGDADNKKAAAEVGVKINMASPPLEAFGNAKTVRNDNSSRFGKFMRVQFDSSGFLVGAHITKYLLEKSRIVTASPGERVYHSFYLVVRGEKNEYKLDRDATYKSLSAGNMLANKEFDSKEEFEEVWNAMSTGLGIDVKDVDSIWRTVTGVLNALNIGFSEDGEGSVIKDDTKKYVDLACEFWSIDAETFRKEAVTTTVLFGGQWITKVLNPTKAIDGLQALTKATYDCEFSWLVEKCNAMLDKGAGGNWVGLLDIFGFEDFEINSFEQICINLANEALQGHYNTFIFSKDMDLCRAEGIDVASVVFPDNSECLRLVDGKGGLLDLLDEECMLGKGTPMGWLSNIEARHKKNPFFLKKPQARSSFIVKHYAGDVSYEVDGILDKNRDTLKDSYKRMMRASTDPFIASLLPEPVEGGKPKTVGQVFKEQVGMLMDLINSTNPHWIRCVKPHPAKKPLMFDGLTTMKQLASSGVLGTVKIRKAGYPIRLNYNSFKVRYKVIVPDPTADPKGVAEQAFQLLNFDAAKGQLGKTIVFLKTEGYVGLEACKKEKLKVFARRLVTTAHMHIARKVVACQKRVSYVVLIQSFLRNKPSEVEWRRRQYKLVEADILEATRQLLNGVKEEEKKRDDIALEEDAAWEGIMENMAKTMEDVIKQWHEQKPARDKAARLQMGVAEEEARHTLSQEEQAEWEALLDAARESIEEAEDAQYEREEREQWERENAERLEAERLAKLEEARQAAEREAELLEIERLRRLALAAWDEHHKHDSQKRSARLQETQRRREHLGTRAVDAACSKSLKESERQQIAKRRLAYPKTAFDPRGRMPTCPSTTTHVTMPTPAQQSPSPRRRISTPAEPFAPGSPMSGSLSHRGSPQFSAGASAMSAAALSGPLSPDFPSANVMELRKNRLSQARLAPQANTSLDMVARLRALKDCKDGRLLISPKIALRDPRNPENPNNPYWVPPADHHIIMPDGSAVAADDLSMPGEDDDNQSGRRRRRRQQSPAGLFGAVPSATK